MYFAQTIRGGRLRSFDSYIPVNYHHQLMMGELHAHAFYEGEDETGKLVGVTVTADHMGWLEIVWVSMAEEYRRAAYEADLLRHRIGIAQRSGKYIGAFWEIHKDEQTDSLRDVLILAGMTVNEEKNNIYELTVGDAKACGAFQREVSGPECLSVGEASDEVLSLIEDEMETDKRPIPKPYETEWEDYLQDISVVCMEDGAPKGLMLFTEEKDYLVLELAYSKSPKVLLGMIVNVLQRAEGVYPDSQKILVPIVGRGVKEIIERLLPDAKRGDIYQARIRFEEPDIPPVMKMIYEHMTVTDGI